MSTGWATVRIEHIAAICHEANRILCKALCDDSQSHWESARERQQLNSVAGVKFRLANPQSTPAEQHQAWYDAHAKEGWKHGPIKDELKKEHPCMMPYAELPPEQRFKDVLFAGIVDLFAKEELVLIAGKPKG